MVMASFALTLANKYSEIHLKKFFAHSEITDDAPFSRPLNATKKVLQGAGARVGHPLAMTEALCGTL